jgi:hypothetical protein
VHAGAYRGLGFPGAEGFGNMFQFKPDFEHDYCATRSVEISRALNPQLPSLDTRLARNNERIPPG